MEPLLASPLIIAGASSALIAGATGSLHCALMCGPLACAGLPREGPGRTRALISWQLGRVAAYALVGGLLGLAGRGLARILTVDVQPYLPWVMAAGLVATALELGKHLRPIPGVARISRGLAAAGSKLSPAGRSLALGMATPFLPCGLLYGVFLAAIATGSGAGGAAVMAMFALGAIPALGGLQLGTRLWSRWPKATVWLRRGVPLVAAVVLVWRAVAASTGQPPKCH